MEFRCCDLDAAALSGVVQEGDLVVGQTPRVFQLDGVNEAGTAL